MAGVLVPTVSEQAWLAARRLGVSASEIAVILGLSPYSSPFELYYRKRGELPGQPDSDAMAIGRAMENYVADYFRQKHPQFHLWGGGRELYRHPDRDWQMATPDRVVFESARSPHTGDLLAPPLAVLECKVDNGDGFGEEGTDDIPVHYRCQVLWQMDTLGVTTGYLAALIWHRRQVRVYELTMDDQAEADLELMRGEAEAFLECVRLGVAPEPDWRPATSSALKHLHPEITDVDVPVSRQTVISYRAACKAHKAAERRKDEMTNRILALIGDGHRAVDCRTGDVIATRQVYPVKESVRRGYTVRKLVPARAPKESTS
jgi:putative phage-type endonuclease